MLINNVGEALVDHVNAKSALQTLQIKALQEYVKWYALQMNGSEHGD